MNQHRNYQKRPTHSLPSISTMLHGVPRLADCPTNNHHHHRGTLSANNITTTIVDNRATVVNKRPQLPVGHRRHASEYITSSSSRSMVFRGIDMSSSSSLPPPPPAPAPTRSLGALSSSTATTTSSASANSNNSPSTTSSAYSPSSLPGDDYCGGNEHIYNNSSRAHLHDKSNATITSSTTKLLRPHLPPPPQLMQPEFRSSAGAPGTTSSLPLDMQTLSISSSCNASSSVATLLEQPRRRTHSRSLSDLTYSSSSIQLPDSNSNYWPASPASPSPSSSQPLSATFPPPSMPFAVSSRVDVPSISSAATVCNGIAVRCDHSHNHYGQQQHYNPCVNNEAFYQQHRQYQNSNNNQGQGSSSAVTTTTTASTSSGANRYSCPYCRKGFSRPSSLRTHTYSHTGEKPFICTVDGCHRRFSVHSNLRRHLRIHRTSRSPSSGSSAVIQGFTVGYGFCTSSWR